MGEADLAVCLSDLDIEIAADARQALLEDAGECTSKALLRLVLKQESVH